MLLECCSTGSYDESVMFQWVLQYFTSTKLVDLGSLLLESCSTGCYDKSVLLQWVLQYFTSAAKLVDVDSFIRKLFVWVL